MGRHDLRRYLLTQGQETRRAFFIHAPAMDHKTTLARRMRDVLGAYLLDLQAHFLERPELSVARAPMEPSPSVTVVVSSTNSQ